VATVITREEKKKVNSGGLRSLLLLSTVPLAPSTPHSHPITTSPLTVPVSGCALFSQLHGFVRQSKAWFGVFGFQVCDGTIGGITTIVLGLQGMHGVCKLRLFRHK
jgi:hypothetical protein